MGHTHLHPKAGGNDLCVMVVRRDGHFCLCQFKEANTQVGMGPSSSMPATCANELVLSQPSKFAGSIHSESLAE